MKTIKAVFIDGEMKGKIKVLEKVKHVIHFGTIKVFNDIETPSKIEEITYHMVFKSIDNEYAVYSTEKNPSITFELLFNLLK